MRILSLALCLMTGLLFAGCGDSNSHAPVADAGIDQNVATGSTVTLDGSGSSDRDGDALTYFWRFDSLPEGSTATLSNDSTVLPTFTADLDGVYVLVLVVSDGVLLSDPDPVTITAATANSAPVAAAGVDQNVATGSTVTLDGSGSSDADLDLLSYSWSLTTRPAGSTASLSDAAAVGPTFIADVDGAYEAQLIVHDGTVASSPDTVTIIAATANSAPVAAAGADQNVATGSTVTLDGSGSSDADLDPLGYSWSLTTRPAGSTASLSDAAAVGPTFVADVDGAYVAQLIVNDGTEDSSPDTVTITAAVDSAPVANAGDDQAWFTGALVALDGSSSSDADRDPLSYRWDFVSRPAGSTAALSDPTAADPVFTADQPGTYLLRLVVSDGFLESAPDQVQVTIIDEPAALGIWLIDEGSGSVVADSSGNGLDGTIVNDPTWVVDRAGNDGEALLFDGVNDWVNLPDTLKARHITLAAWVKISDTSTAERPIFSAERGAGATGFAYRLQINNGRVRMEAVAPYSTSTARQFTTAEPLTLNVWHHVAGTYDGNDVKVYVDGVLAGTASYASYQELNQDATIPVALGHLENWSVQWFKGAIDDARVYDAALGAAEIAILASP